MISESIYLDYNATTPIVAEVADAMRPFIELEFGNPSSIHSFGIKARKAVETARGQVAILLGCSPDEIVFTSGGTESNNMAIKGAAFANRSKGNHIITSMVEHPAVMEVCSYLQKYGFRITYLPVDEYGIVSPTDLETAVCADTILITIMHANNEVGTVQPIRELATIANHRDILFHTDAAQSAGKIYTDISEICVDMLSLAGHKLYAPKGIGALYIKQGVRIDKLMHGATHERNLRAGTENVTGIVGLGKACEISFRDLDKNRHHFTNCRDRLEKGLMQQLSGCKMNGHPVLRLPNTLSISFAGLEAESILAELTTLAASAGAACHAPGESTSGVLAAMNVPNEFAKGTIRFSVGRSTSIAEIDKSIELIVGAVTRMKPRNPATNITGNSEVKLTHFTHGLGCACKLRPHDLEEILKQLPVINDPNVLIGPSDSDDAAVYKLNDEMAIVQTVDCFTPVVDDPYNFGAIAAANAISDIYAMGAKPLFALNIVGFPTGRLPGEVLLQILRGAADKAKEAGVLILGGHSIEDTEPKFGMAVTGIVHPDKVLTNAGAKHGDSLILTKPIGLGVIATAVKRGMANPEIEADAIRIMSQLNSTAAHVMDAFSVNACTDVTGFGLLGHLSEMTIASGVEAILWAESIPVIQGAIELVRAGAVPGGTLNNIDYFGSHISFAYPVSDAVRTLLFDAQTSGGLLISLPENDALQMIEELHTTGIAEAACIGKINLTGKGMITVKEKAI
jgi:cysteine desulfurase